MGWPTKGGARAAQVPSKAIVTCPDGRGPRALNSDALVPSKASETVVSQPGGEMPAGWYIKFRDKGACWFIESPTFASWQDARIAFFDLNPPPRKVPVANSSGQSRSEEAWDALIRIAKAASAAHRWIKKNGQLESHAHNREGTACAACKTLNEIQESLAVWGDLPETQFTSDAKEKP